MGLLPLHNRTQYYSCVEPVLYLGPKQAFWVLRYVTAKKVARNWRVFSCRLWQNRPHALALAESLLSEVRLFLSNAKASSSFALALSVLQMEGGECVDQVVRGCFNNGTCVAPDVCECAEVS